MRNDDKPASAGEQHAKRPVTLVAAVTALCLLGDSMLYVVLPIYWRDAGLDSLWQVGILLSINRFVRLPLNPLIGWLYNRLPLRTGLIVAVVLGAATTVGYGVWHGFAAWLVLRAAWGIAWSLLRMGGYLTVIGYSTDSSRGQWMGRFNGISRIGSLFGMLLGGVLVPIWGLSAVAIGFGAAALVGLPLIARTIARASSTWASSAQASSKGSDAQQSDTQQSDTQHGKTEHGKAQHGKTEHSAPGASDAKQRETAPPMPNWHRSPLVRKAIAAGLGLTMAQSIPVATLSLVIDSNYPDAISLFGLMLGGTALAGMLQAVRWTSEPLLASTFGKLSDGPRGRLPLFAAALLVSAAAYALLPWPLPPPLWLAAVVTVMVAGTALTTLMDTIASDAARSSSVVPVMTTYSVATDLGAAIGPAVTFAIAGAAGGLPPVYIGCAALLGVIAAAYWPRRTGRFSKPAR